MPMGKHLRRHREMIGEMQHAIDGDQDEPQLPAAQTAISNTPLIEPTLLKPELHKRDDDPPVKARVS
jgi:hypothetical protein